MEWVILGMLIACLIVGVILYNRLVSLRNGSDNAFSQINVQLKRRHDLIPKLIDAVKGYMAHESGTLQAVVEARSAASSAREKVASSDDVSAEDIQKLARTENALGATLGKLFALSEAYPDLKANTNFLNYQEELVSTENRIGYARQAYNDAVMDYNNAVETVPSNIIAGIFNFRRKTALEFADQSDIEVVPNASFT